MRTISIIMLLFAASFAAQGQLGGFRMGFIGGPSVSEFDYNADYVNDGDANSVAGYQAGIFVQYDSRIRLSYRAGLIWSHTGDVEKGGAYDGGPFYGPQYETRYVHEDVLLPMELLFNFSKKENRFYLIGGLAPSFRIKREVEETQWWEGGPISRVDVTNQMHYRDVDLFVTVGAGYAFRLGGKVGMFVQPVISSNLPGNMLDMREDNFGWLEFRNPTVYTMSLQVGVDVGWK